MKKVIIFDMDGVIFDSIDIAYNLILDDHPEMTKDRFLELFVGNIHDEIVKYREKNPLQPKTEEEKEARKIRYAREKLESRVFPGMVELLTKLHKDNKILVLNTNAFERNCIPLLKKAHLYDLFDMLATAEVSKSKLEKFRFIKEKYNVPADEILFITDTLGDVREANEADIQTIAVTWGAHTQSHFNRESYKNLLAVVDSSQELEKYIISK